MIIKEYILFSDEQKHQANTVDLEDYLRRTLPDAGAGCQKGGIRQETATDAGYHKEKAWDYSARESGQGPERL